MELSGSLINKKCEDGDSNKVKASRNGPGFSHMFFADDLLLFAKSNQKNCETISDVLEEFCSLSGQKISKEKSKIFFSPNVLEEDCATMVQQLGINKTNNLEKYLGFPFKHKGKNRNQFQSVVDKVHAKLASWKTKCLSPIGRLVLIKASITPLLNIQCNVASCLLKSMTELTSLQEIFFGVPRKRKGNPT